VGTEELRKRLTEIEHSIDAGTYRPGPWERLIREIRGQPDDVREALAGDISRVSRKLHMRGGRRTASVANGMTRELAATAVGAILLGSARSSSFDVAAIIAMLIWVTTFQPILKVCVGLALGVGYEYAFLHGIEPRFKMKFGTYVAAPRWKRIALHAFGMIGSALAAIIVALIADTELPTAAVVSWVVLWVVIAINLIALLAGALGIRRVGPVRTTDSSGGAAGIELREALGL
jgi:hypothetical protein